jgi:serine protease Do
MDDKRDPLFDLSEIERIQREIERNLYGKAPEASAAETPHPAMTKLEANPAPTTPPAAFYKETIKNESVRKKKKKRNRALVAVALIICTLGTGTLGVGIGMAIPFAQNMLSPGLERENEGNATDQPLNENLSHSEESLFERDENGAIILKSLSDVVALVAPSVVSINTVSKSSGDIFSLPYNTPGAASGIIFFKNETKFYIVTNHHVTSGSTSVTVNVEDSEPIAASFVGSEPDSDLAIIAVTWEEAKKANVIDVTLASFGDSDTAMVGDAVIAIGNAMGEGKTATSGIVSATNKEITVENKKLTVMQTDAAINPGNSGGPLVNTMGQIIGINTAKFSQYQVEGMGYSITSNIAKPIIEGIMKQKPKPFLGIQGQDVTEEIAEMYGIPQLGVFVVEIVSGSSAEKAGLLRNDIITSFNGVSIFSMEQLQSEIQALQVGDQVEVKVYREGKNPIVFKLRLSEYRSDNF